MAELIEEPQNPEQPKRASKNLVLLFITLMLVMLLAALSQNVLSSALPTIVGELHGVDQMMWVITAYLLASTITMPIYGTISDVVGRKPMLIGAITLFVLGSVIGGLAPSMPILIAARFVQGLGGGGLMIMSQAAIADVVPARERGKYMGIMGGVFAFSSVAGPLIGGWLTVGPGWRWAFWLNVPLGIIALAATIILLKLPKREDSVRSRVDYLGIMLLAVGTACLVLVGTWGGSTFAWGSPQIIGLAAATIVAAALFVLVESRVKYPIMPLKLFTNRNFVLTTFSGLFIAVAMFGAIGYLPTYYQMAVGASAQESGLLMVPMMGAVLITSVLTGAAVSKTGRYKTFTIIGALSVAAGLGLLSTVHYETHVAVIAGYTVVLGFGLGMNMQLLTLIAQNSFPHRIVGAATSSTQYFRQVGGSLGSAVVGSLFVGRLSTLLDERLPDGAGPADGASSLTPDLVKALPTDVQDVVVHAYNEALLPIFLYVMPLALVTAIMLFFLKEVPLATTVDDAVADTAGQGQYPVSTGAIRTMDEGRDDPDDRDEPGDRRR